MPKQLINLIGVVVAAGILLLAVVLGVLPQLSTAGTTNAQADQVATTNSVYQARINQLQRQKQNLPQIKATVARLHRQIPAEYRLDDVFRLVAQAAESSKATITSVTAGAPAAFTAYSAPVPAGQPTPTPGASPTPTPAASPAPASSTAPGAAAAPPETAAGRTQIPFAITVTVPDAKAASAFLDALRAGPRLLANLTSTATTTTTGVDLQVSALAFADPSTAARTHGGN